MTDCKHENNEEIGLYGQTLFKKSFYKIHKLTYKFNIRLAEKLNEFIFIRLIFNIFDVY